MALLVTSAGTALAIHIDSISYKEVIDDPATATFDVPDLVAYSLSQYQVVNITDTATGVLLYAGYIVSVADVAFPGNLGIRMRTITCTGNRWLAEKRYWTGPEFDGWTAGDVAAEVHRVLLAAEGVTAAYALRHDMDAASFGAGTLSGTSAASGVLTLASSGSDFTQVETSNADFSTGTLTTIGGISGGYLALTSYQAIKYSGSAGANLDNNNLYTYTKIWAGSPYTLVAGDEIYVDQWIDSRSPEIKAGIDILFSDGTWMHDFSTDFQDREVIPLYAGTDLKGWADDQWYLRKCIVQAPEAGKVVTAVYLSFQGEKGGDYTAYFKNIKITNAGGATLRRSIFSGGDTTLAANVKASSNGYFNFAASVVTAYAQTGVRVSPARSITSVGIVSGSVINWTEVDSVQPTGAASTYPPQVLIEASMDDGATWDACTNHAPLPGLLVGMNTSGRTITLRETLSIGGPDPTKAPTLASVSFTVTSAAAASKTDFFDFRQSQAQLAAGALTNATSYSGVGLQTTGNYRNWDDLDFSSQSLFGQTGAGNPAQGVQTGYFFLRTDSGLDVRSQFVFAGGNWQNFIAEIDIHFISNVGGTEYGFVYRTTGPWSNTNNTYAYAAELTSNNIILNRAANGGTPGFTRLQTVSLSLTVGDWYRMKIVVNGSSHKVYINDVLFINWTDSTYTAAGYVGVRLWNSTGNRDSAHFDNFGIVAYESDLQSVSSWVTPALALSLTGLVGNSQLNWNAQVPSSSQLVVESTLDNGANWNTCTNGGPIPLLVPGYNMAGQSLKVRYSMTNQSINLPIVLQGHSVFVIGQYSASGTRISPVLALGPAGTIGSSSVSWVDSVPPSTSVAVATSPDNSSYTGVGSSGSPIPGLVAQGAMTADDFDVNSAANYTAAFWSGGVLPVFTIDTAHSRMQVTSGTNGILVWGSGPSAKDVYLELITDQCDAAGLVWRYTSVDNCYYATYRDQSSATNPGTVAIRKRVAAVDTQLVAPVALPSTFLRGTYHTLKVTMAGSLITAYFDGVQAAQVSDSSLTAAGSVGLRQNSSVTSQWYSFRAQQLGASAAGQNVYSKVTLTSTDPTVKPSVSSLVTSVRGPDLMTGALIPATDYAYKKKGSEILLDVAGQSKMYTGIDKNRKLFLKDRAYTPAPWPLYSADPLFQGARNPPTATRQSPAYRNRQYVYNAVSLQSYPESKVGDGSTQSWVLTYKVDSITALSLDGNPQTWGVQGVDSGKNFYYTPGQNSLSADPALFPEQGAAITLVYVAQVPYTSMRESTVQQAILAAVDGTTGIVEASEDAGGLPAAAADSIAQARIDERAILAVDWEYFTARSGLAAGQLQTMFVPEHGLVDIDMLITEINTILWADVTGGLNYDCDVKATSGPNVGTWQRIFAQP